MGAWLKAGRLLAVTACGYAFLSVGITLPGRASEQTTSQSSPTDLKDPKLISDGNSVFAESCSIAYCHGREGAAGRAPALRDRKWSVTQLHKIVREGIPNTSMLNFDDKLSERQIWAVVAYVLSIGGRVLADSPPDSPDSRAGTSGVTAGLLPESLVGDPARGEELFFAAPGEKGRGRACAGCHAIDGKGNSVGPELSGSARKSARDIFRDVVFPNAHVDPAQRVFRITMKDGEKISGLKQEESTVAIRAFDMGSNPPVLRRLAKDQIQVMEMETQSPMPSHYGEIYTLRQLLDLVSFIKSSGAPAAVRVSFLDIVTN